MADSLPAGHSVVIAGRRSLCLDHLSLYDETALTLIEVAHRIGCDAVSMFVTPLPMGPYRDLINDLTARAKVVAALARTGLAVGLVEPFMLDERIDWDQMERAVELAVELGGVVNALCMDGERGRLEASFDRLVGLARGVGARIAIEGFSLSSVRTPAEALKLADLAGDDVGLTLDTLHIVRTGGSWADVAALPAERIYHVQINDGPLVAPDDLAHEAVAGRLPPGQGQFDIAALLPLVPATARLAVEAPFPALPGISPVERGRMLIAGVI